MKKQRNQFTLQDFQKVEEFIVLGNTGAGVKGHHAEIKRNG